MRLARTTSALILTVAGLSLAACGGEAEEPASTQQPSPSATASASASASESAARKHADGSCTDPGKADRTDASSTAYHYVAIAHCWDSTLDQSTTSGILRASELMSAEYYDSQQEPERNSLQRQFNDAYAHKAYSVPSVSRTVGDIDQDVAEDKAVRGYNTKWYWQGRDAEQIPGGRDQVIVYLEKHDGKWYVVAQQTTVSEELDSL